jgi:hypothetical protein
LAAVQRLGISPGGSLALFRTAQARAQALGRDFVIPDNVRALAGPVFAHRLMLETKAKYGGARPRQIIEELLEKVPAPQPKMTLHDYLANQLTPQGVEARPADGGVLLLGPVGDAKGGREPLTARAALDLPVTSAREKDMTASLRECLWRRGVQFLCPLRDVAPRLQNTLLNDALALIARLVEGRGFRATEDLIEIR